MPSEASKTGPRSALNAIYCRQQAAAMRRLAETRQHLRAILLGVAEDYEELAEDLELGVAMLRHANLLPPG
jgi:hypothetical protein